MSDELPEYLKRKLLKKWMSKSLKKSGESTQNIGEDPEKIVWSKLVDERAREFMYKVKKLYPDKYSLVIQVFYELLKRKIVTEYDGYTTLTILHRLGIPIKPDLKIKFVKHGKEVDMKEYLE